MNCRLHKCKAACCCNVPFENNELERYKDKIVRPIIDVTLWLNAVVPVTAIGLKNNYCPFLRPTDLKCNIYDNRPEICRLMGTIDKMKCNYFKLKQNGKN